jgi:NADH:ubiquinone oxidoreductase subunit 6 (subunit J)
MVLGFIYIIAVPIALVWIISLYRKNSKCQVWHCRYGHLIQPYKNRFFWWELVFLIEKTILVFVVDITNGLPTSLQVLALEILLLANYVVEDYVRPFRRSGISLIAAHS